MSEKKSISLPSCTSCNRIIHPDMKATKFQCPNCGTITIWRCEKCRNFSRNYYCPNCSLIGP